MDTENATLRVGWRVIAIVAWVVVAGLLVAVGALLALRQSDALAALALALAVISLLLQILVFVAQAATSGQAATALAEVRSGVSQVRGRLEGDYAAMVDRVLASAGVAAAKGDGGARASSTESFDTVLSAVRSAIREVQPVQQDATPAAAAGADEARTLVTYPQDTQDVRDNVATLLTLRPHERARLAEYGMDHVKSALSGLPPGLWISSDKPGALTQVLIQHGLVESASIPPGYPKATFWHRLTPLGIQVARLMTAAGNPPGFLKDLGLVDARNSSRERTAPTASS